jgi:hypothetical protein
MPDDFSRGFDKGLGNAPTNLNAGMGEIYGQKAGEERRNERAISVNLGRRAIGIAAAILAGIVASTLAPAGRHAEVGFVAAIFTYIVVMTVAKRMAGKK